MAMPAALPPEPRPTLSVVTPPASLAIEVRDLTRTYGTATAVDALSLGIRAGEVYGFLGPNGAGKTTTLRMLLGLIAPTRGTISILGHEPGTPAALARIGSMIETPAFYPFLSGRDNLALLAAYTGTPVDRIETVLDMVDLSSRGDDAFRTYSLGMKQRLGVAAALLKDPPLLLLDEPTNGLDPAGMADMRRLIRRLGNEGRTVMLSSHLMPEVEKVCDRIGIIAHGRLVFEGTIDDLRGEPALVVRVDDPVRARSVLLDRPGISEAELSGTALRLAGDDIGDPAAINGALVNAGFAVRELRPEQRPLEQVFLELTGTEASHAHQVH
jgi:ABC-2 type transport system ATP-binding protein